MRKSSATKEHASSNGMYIVQEFLDHDAEEILVKWASRSEQTWKSKSSLKEELGSHWYDRLWRLMKTQNELGEVEASTASSTDDDNDK
jgi:hypothetical protein